MKVDGRWRRALERTDDGAAIVVLDQVTLPFAVSWLRLDDLAFVNRASAYFKLGRLDRSLVDLNEALRLNDRRDRAYYERAARYGIKGDRAVVERWGVELDYEKVMPLLALDGKRIVADATLHRALQLRDDLMHGHPNLHLRVDHRTNVLGVDLGERLDHAGASRDDTRLSNHQARDGAHIWRDESRADVAERGQILGQGPGDEVGHDPPRRVVAPHQRVTHDGREASTS